MSVAAPLLSVSVDIVPALFGVTLSKDHEPAKSIVSLVAKPLIEPEKPAGSVRSSTLFEPEKAMVWPAATVESNSSVAPPEIVSVPVPVTAPAKSSVPELTDTPFPLTKFGAITLVAVPPVFSNSPLLTIREAVDVPRATPLSSAMS